MKKCLYIIMLLALTSAHGHADERKGGYTIDRENARIKALPEDLREVLADICAAQKADFLHSFRGVENSEKRIIECAQRRQSLPPITQVSIEVVTPESAEGDEKKTQGEIRKKSSPQEDYEDEGLVATSHDITYVVGLRGMQSKGGGAYNTLYARMDSTRHYDECSFLFAASLEAVLGGSQHEMSVGTPSSSLPSSISVEKLALSCDFENGLFGKAGIFTGDAPIDLKTTMAEDYGSADQRDPFAVKTRGVSGAMLGWRSEDWTLRLMRVQPRNPLYAVHDNNLTTRELPEGLRYGDVVGAASTYGVSLAHTVDNAVIMLGYTSGSSRSMSGTDVGADGVVRPIVQKQREVLFALQVEGDICTTAAAARYAQSLDHAVKSIGTLEVGCYIPVLEDYGLVFFQSGINATHFSRGQAPSLLDIDAPSGRLDTGLVFAGNDLSELRLAYSRDLSQKNPDWYVDLEYSRLLESIETLGPLRIGVGVRHVASGGQDDDLFSGLDKTSLRLNAEKTF